MGLFGLAGEQRSASGFAGTATGSRDTDKQILGLDLSGSVSGNIHWYAQGLWNQWDDFLDEAPGVDYEWFGGFAGIDYVHSDRCSFSLVYNYAEAGDFEETGIDLRGHRDPFRDLERLVLLHAQRQGSWPSARAS